MRDALGKQVKSFQVVRVFVALTTVFLTSAPLLPAYSQSNTSNSDMNRQAVSNADSRETDVVVVGQRPVIINGRVIRCEPRQDDLLDRVDLHSLKGLSNWSPVPKYMAIVPDRKHGFVWVTNSEQLTGPDYWQRVGVGMTNYVFRSSPDEKPMCVGGHAGPYTFAGFRKIIDAVPYRGHRIRFTAWVATSHADQVSFWLAAESMINTKNGGNTNNVPFGGDHLWTPVLLETGPIKNSATRVSFGFNLQGSGDVWVYHPRLEVLGTEEWDGSNDDRIVFGVSRR